MPITSENILYGLKLPRFRFWKILLVVASIFLLSTLISVSLALFAPKDYFKKNPTFSLRNMFTFSALGQQLIFQLFNTIFLYCILNIFFYANKLKKKAKDYIIYVLVFIGLFVVYMQLSEVLFPDNTEKVKRMIGINDLTIFMIIGYVVWIVIYMLVVVFALSYAQAKDEKQRNQELLERNSLLEIEKLRAEYNFLKAQINPHFLHNSLNFLYAKSLPYSPELSEGILTISEIMRYALMNEVDSDGLVLLNKEIGHIQNIIRMNQLRFDNKLSIDFHVVENIGGVKILPLILITIIENAFKHGDVHNTEIPLQIGLELDENYIYFTCANKKKTGPKELSFGIGLNNTKRRLQMIYGDDAKISINDTKYQYEVQLKIPYTR